MLRDCKCSVSEETVERYCLGRLESEELERFEEHLLVCPGCQDRVAASDEYIAAMKLALRDIRARQAKPAGPRWNPLRWTPLLAAGVAAAALAVFVHFRSPAGDPAPHMVSLRAIRGFEDPAAAAPAGALLVLKADLSELPEMPSYRIAIADQGGAILWQASGTPEQGQLTVTLPRKLAPGRYWVRLLGGGNLLREFGLKVE